MTDDIWPVHEAMLAHLEIASAGSVLDIGCGRGEHLQRLAGGASDRARLVGIDASGPSVEAARTAARDDARCEFLVHDVTRGLPFEDFTFDRVLSVNMLEAIPDKRALLHEVHRVLKPNGLVVVAHFDWDSQLYDGLDKSLVRRIVSAFADWQQAWMADSDGWMGRRLWRTIQDTGLFTGRVDARVHVSTTYAEGCYGWERARDFGSMVKRGLIDAAQYDAFRTTLEQFAATGQYCYAITLFGYVGRPVGA